MLLNKSWILLAKLLWEEMPTKRHQRNLFISEANKLDSKLIKAEFLIKLVSLIQIRQKVFWFFVCLPLNFQYDCLQM